MRVVFPRGFGAAGLAATLAIAASAPGAEGGQQFTVVMNNMNFGQMPAQLHVGDAIVWSNQDTVQHSATARDGSFDIRLQPGQKGRTVLKKTGKIAVDCLYHPTMRTVLNVLPATK
jgi:plastocyanin